MRIRFIIYGLIGWCAEVFWTGLISLWKGDVKLSSYSSIWMFFIYGSAVFLEPVHNKIRYRPMLVRGLIYTVLIFTAEFLSGWLLQSTLGACPWDYSSSPYSVMGLIRFDYAPVWMAAGLLFEFLHDKLFHLEHVIKGV